MNTKNLFIASAIIEFMTGFALIVLPSLTIELLLGLPPGNSSGVIAGRVAGAAIIALAIACWFAREDAQSRAAKGLITAMFLYNITALVILAYAGFTSQITAMLLMAMIAHLLLSGWCIYALKKAN